MQLKALGYPVCPQCRSMRSSLSRGVHSANVARRSFIGQGLILSKPKSQRSTLPLERSCQASIFPRRLLLWRVVKGPSLSLAQEKNFHAGEDDRTAALHLTETQLGRNAKSGLSSSTPNSSILPKTSSGRTSTGSIRLGPKEAKYVASVVLIDSRDRLLLSRRSGGDNSSALSMNR